MKCVWSIPILWAALAASGQAFDFGLAPLEPQGPVETPQLEADPHYLPGEFWTLHEQPLQVTEPDATQVALSSEVNAALTAQPVEQRQEEYFTLDELKTEMKKLAWTKGEYRIVPYGYVSASLISESQRTYPGDYTFFVYSPVPSTEQLFHVDAKSTRVGLDLSGPAVGWCGGAASGGKVEIDFQGSFVTENKAGVLLRHAYCEVKNEEFRLVAGQTWDVISPLYPGVITYPVGWAGGNIGYRRAQFRGERYFAWSDSLLFTAQGSLNVDIASDFAGSTLNQGDHSGWPVLEGRLATTIGPRGKGCRPIQFGVSGHIGEQKYDFYNGSTQVASNEPERTWSLNADIRIPLGERWGFQGEFFTGENLGTFLGGILQGVNVQRAPVTQTFISANTVRSTGGWFEVWYDWRSDLHSHFGYSLDDPCDSDLTSGRLYNQFYFGNIIYDVTPKFALGLELTQWKTLWVGSPTGDSTRVEFQAKYGF